MSHTVYIACYGINKRKFSTNVTLSLIQQFARHSEEKVNVHLLEEFKTNTDVLIMLDFVASKCRLMYKIIYIQWISKLEKSDLLLLP